MSGCLSKYDGYKRYMSADTAARRDEIGQKIATSSTEIEENNEILRGLKRLSDENRIHQVLSRREEFEYAGEHWDYLQQELNATFNMRDLNVRGRELGDVLFYYLLRDEEPVREIQQLINILLCGCEEESWYGICASMLGFDFICGSADRNAVFPQFYKQLENNPQHVEYLIDKHPQLLFNKYSCVLINKLNDHLPHDNLHQILLNTRDENQQTFMFHNDHWFRDIADCSLDDDVYGNKLDNLLELLSVRNKSGKTAFHENSRTGYKALLEHITLNNQDKVDELLSIRDNNNKTVYDTANGWHKNLLTWFKHQYEHKNYPLYYGPCVIILYNTDDRLGACEEAYTILEAFIPAVTLHIEREKMGTKPEVLELIKKKANMDHSALIVCLMSHGNIGTIDDSEGNPITLTSIEGAMCSNQLKERPKILITQSCQTRAGGIKRTHEEAFSSNTDPGPPRDAFVPNIPYEPLADHFLSVQSCVSGQTSTRNVFIPYLAEQIKNSSKNDRFQDLVELASFKMATEKNKQTPIMKSTLIGKVCLKDNGYHWYEWSSDESGSDDEYYDDESDSD